MNTAESKAPNGEALATTGPKVASRDKLLSDLRIVVTDADEYLRASVGEASEACAAARARLEATLSSVRADLEEMKRDLVGTARVAVRAADDYVHENPWRSIAVVAGAGLVAGLLVARR